MAEVDISKVINIIMENPKLLDEIKSLAAGESEKESIETVPIEQAQSIDNEIPASAQIPQKAKSKRTELLDALKPYISDERKKAIESFVTIAEILEVMRSK